MSKTPAGFSEMGGDEQIPLYEKRKVDVDCLRRELAIHEASHFVFNCLALENLEGFKDMDYMITCFERYEEEGFNRVSGMTPAIKPQRSKAEAENEIAKFYMEDHRRIIAKLLSHIAAYSSYQVFISNSIYYINGTQKFVVEDKKVECTYFAIEGQNMSGTYDFKNVEKKLREVCNTDKDEIIEVMKKLTFETQGLMRINEVNECIEYIANKLLESECKRIEGEELKRLVADVQKKARPAEYIDTLTALSSICKV